MRTIRLDASDASRRLVRLSDACECMATTIIIDVSAYAGQLPGCAYELVLKNPAGVVYRRDLACEAGHVTYTVNGSDTAISGQGEMQLLVKGASGEKVLTRMWGTLIDKSLLEDEVTDPPDPLRPLVEEMEAIRDEATGFFPDGGTDGQVLTKSQTGTEWRDSAAALVPATDKRLGGIKVGSGLNVADDGTLSLKYADVSNAQGGRTITIG